MRGLLKVITLIGCSLIFLLITACVSDSEQNVEPLEKRIERAKAQYERHTAKSVAPPHIDQLLDQLMKFQAEVGRMPASLTELAEHLSIPDDQREMLMAYAYSPRGLGVLKDGRLILLVDSQITPPDQAWCIIQNAAVYNGPVFIEADLITMDALKDAANNAP